MGSIGRILVIMGFSIAAIGALFMILSKMNVSIPRLPGDIVIHRKNFTFYFPLATSIILSIFLSLLVYIISRFHK